MPLPFQLQVTGDMLLLDHPFVLPTIAGHASLLLVVPVLHMSMTAVQDTAAV